MGTENWKLITDGSADTAALADPAPTATKPTEAAGVTGTAAVVKTGGRDVVRVMIGGTDGDGETINYQVIGWTQVLGPTDVAYIPEILAKGVATLGTDVYAATTIGAGTEQWADTITDTADRVGNVVYSPADNTRASIQIPLRGAGWIEIQVDRGTAATIDVFIEFCDQAALAAVDVEVEGGEVDLEAGGNGMVALDSLVDSSGEDLTYTPVPIDIGATTWKDLGTAGAGTKVRLHELVLTFSAAGTWRLCSDDDGAGTTPLDLMGSTMYAGANVVVRIPWVASIKGRPECPNSKHLSFYSTVACDGRAVTSNVA